MYYKKVIHNRVSKEGDQISIGPDEIRLKRMNSLFEDSNILHVEGDIFNVGVDFVDILRKDNHIVTVLTDRIANIKWLDERCRHESEFCHHNRSNCQCFEFMRCPNCCDEHGKTIKEKKYKRNKACSECGSFSCHCKDKTHRNIDRIKSKDLRRAIKRSEDNHCSKCGHDKRHKQGHCPHCEHGHNRNDNDLKGFRKNHLRHKFDDHRHNEENCRQCKYTCFCDFPIPFCDDRIELRLAGLHDDLNFQLLQHKGCKVKLDIL
jgi:hypothetical protein